MLWKVLNFFYIFWWWDRHWSAARDPIKSAIDLKILSILLIYLFSKCPWNIYRNQWYLFFSIIFQCPTNLPDSLCFLTLSFALILMFLIFFWGVWKWVLHLSSSKKRFWKFSTLTSVSKGENIEFYKGKGSKLI